MGGFSKKILIFLLLMMSTQIMGDTLNWEKNIRIKVGPYEYTIEQFKGLPKETLKALPFLDFESAKAAIGNIKGRDSASISKQYQLDVIKYRKLGLFTLQEILHTLAYLQELPSFDETNAYKEAVKTFQSAIGSNPTGELLGWEGEKLSELSLPFMETNIDFSDNRKKFFVYPFQGKLSATGAWIKNDNNKKYGRPNAVQITCDKAHNLCEELYLAINPSKGMFPNSYNIEGNNNKYQIEKWSDNEVIAVDLTKKCYVKKLIINIKSENVLLRSTQKTLSKDSPYVCFSEGQVILTELGKNLESDGELMILVDWSEAYESMGSRNTEARRKAMSPKYKALFKKCQILAE